MAQDRHPKLHDPRVLRAIAHPLRNRILGEIEAQGPMRAVDLARELDIPANQASFHLRQLAKYGLVEEDPEAARDRRDRVWRAVAPEGFAVSLKELEAQPGGKAATRVFRRQASSWGHLVVDAAYAPVRERGVHSSVTQLPLRLTRDEAAGLAKELDDLVESWAARNRTQDRNRRTYLYFATLLPYPSLPDDQAP